MINLLPPNVKKRVVIEYWVRVVSVWFMLISFVLMLGVLVMLPVYVLIGTQISVKEKAATEASERVDSYENVSDELINANKEAKYVVDESRYSLFSEYVYLFERLQESEIKIKEIGLNRIGDQISPIRLSGEATDRQALASFRDRILAQEGVKDVDLPISNLAQDRNISFTLTIILANGKEL